MKNRGIRWGGKAYSPEKEALECILEGITDCCLKARDFSLFRRPVKSLDVSILQDHVLGPILGIGPQNRRIDFIGGIRGQGIGEDVKEDMEAAFSMYPTSIEELLNVADAGL